MFLGEAVHTVDAKGRVVIPSKYRSGFGVSLFVMCGLDGCIRAYTETGINVVVEKLNSCDAKRNGVRRKMMASIEELTIDAQGRILLPEKLRKHACISDKLHMVGMGTYLEFWDEAKLEESTSAATPEEEVETMSELGI